MSIPKEPRQLMINLMYLVLTAMLALNITKEVLDAFGTINTSIEQSNKGIADKNENMYKAFSVIGDKSPELKVKAEPLYAKALEIKEETSKMDKYLEDWKAQITQKAGGWITENGQRKIKVMDDIDIPTRMFVEEKNGDKVKAEINRYINTVLSKIPNPEVREALKAQLPLKINEMAKTDLNPSGDWSFGNFHNIPVIAAVTLFSKWQSDVKNTESVLVESLMREAGNEEWQDVIKFDGVMPIATANTSYALSGDEITINVAMAAVNKESNPTITSSVGGPQSIKDGVGTIKFKAAGGAGVHTVNGNISVSSRGKSQSAPWSINYTVGTAGASLQLDKMNVMYIGVDNPVTLSASGYNMEDVTWSMPGATITKVGSGKYNVRVATPNYQGIDYTISAKSKSGALVKVGGGKMRVKNIPPPTIRFDQIADRGRMATGQAKAQLGLLAVLENFDFDYKYLVSSYRLVRLAKGSDEEEIADGTGPSFASSPQVRNLMNKSRPGDTWIFEKMQASGTGQPPKPVRGSIVVQLR